MERCTKGANTTYNICMSDGFLSLKLDGPTEFLEVAKKRGLLRKKPAKHGEKSTLKAKSNVWPDVTMSA